MRLKLEFSRNTSNLDRLLCLCSRNACKRCHLGVLCKLTNRFSSPKESVGSFRCCSLTSMDSSKIYRRNSSLGVFLSACGFERAKAAICCFSRVTASSSVSFRCKVQLVHATSGVGMLVELLATRCAARELQPATVHKPMTSRVRK